MAEVLVRDETMTGREIESWVLPGLPARISAGELVRLRVREEVARFNAGDRTVFTGLVRPGRGFDRSAAEPVDWVAQADAACDAFTRNRFVMIVAGRQVESLDEMIDLREDPAVAFIRLVPLVGG